MMDCLKAQTLLFLAFVGIVAGSQVTKVCSPSHGAPKAEDLTCPENATKELDDSGDRIACCPSGKEAGCIDECMCKKGSTCPRGLVPGSVFSIQCHTCCCYCMEGTDSFKECCDNAVTVCGDPPQLNNGLFWWMPAGQPTPGTVAYYLCDRGYITTSYRLSTTCDANGQWTNISGICEKDPCVEIKKTIYTYASKQTWSNSRNACMVDGGELLHIRDEAEENCARYRCSRFERCWLGLHKSENQTWTWTDDGAESDFDPAFPKPGFDCVRLNMELGRWQAYLCDEEPSMTFSLCQM